MSKILIAEDDKFLSNAYRVKLTKSGFTIEMASDGEEAIKKLATFTPDLIILDLVMPIKDGFAVLRELKANAQWKAIPVIVASNLGQKEDLNKAMSLGASDYLIKSDLHIEDLIGKINGLLLKS